MGRRQGKERSELTEYFLGSILTPVMAPPKGTSAKDQVMQTDVLCQVTGSPGGGGDHGNHKLVGESWQAVSASPHHTWLPPNAMWPLWSRGEGRTGYGP